MIRVWADSQSSGVLDRFESRGSTFSYDRAVDPTLAISLTMPSRGEPSTLPAHRFQLRHPQWRRSLKELRRCLRRSPGGSSSCSRLRSRHNDRLHPERPNGFDAEWVNRVAERKRARAFRRSPITRISSPPQVYSGANLRRTLRDCFHDRDIYESQSCL